MNSQSPSALAMRISHALTYLFPDGTDPAVPAGVIEDILHPPLNSEQARTRAEEIVAACTYLDPYHTRKLRNTDLLIESIASALTQPVQPVPEGFKSISPLRRTADDVIVQIGDWVFVRGMSGSFQVGHAFTIPCAIADEDHNGYRDMRVEECYSTREAALNNSVQTTTEGGGGA